ncbi:endonuclease/exonuclease/phosphatase family protein [Nocardioides daeguensis]|uniref:Endonuclease/exonuclease/phosphatase domain-containing protein n=1 Tax=Nocardioides daeguensis TaxID=908359 RepID=A0ABP6VVQ9_9ACTN|nr:endonuclease/exonuclease/phosphatase family protein [Nocardioides daeguensis]MBV6728397.1 endonuclease/exonuclease/phosphatase family protein [Nocardioides daeguensis]MCR1773821.1 endonuclease/exonuclease/phosphatase family protein [Nocardioides daeguensis]
MEEQGRRGARAGKRLAPAVSSVDMVVTLVAVVVVLAGLSVSLIFPPDEPDTPVAHEGRRDTSGTTSAALANDILAPTDTATGEAGGVLVPPLAMEAERQSAQLVCQAQIGTTQFTALSYNIKSARAGSLDRLLGVMERSKATVLLLQEVDYKRRSTGSVDQAGWFAERLGGWGSAFGRNVTFGDGLYGTAVVSKYPILSSENTPLPNIGRAQPRGLLHVVIDVEGVEVSIYSTHLDNTSANIRTAQASRISSILAADPRPKILGGDMNTWPNSGPERILSSRLSDSYVVAGSGGGATHPASRPRTRIDYLLYGGPDLTATSSVVMSEGGSDHLPVRADFTLGGIKTEKCSGDAKARPRDAGKAKGKPTGPASGQASGIASSDAATD